MKKVNEKNNHNPRREFFKKAAYKAPVLLALGQLAKPTKAKADTGDPSGPPNWGGF
jgi:hypothetical protein